MLLLSHTVEGSFCHFCCLPQALDNWTLIGFSWCAVTVTQWRWVWQFLCAVNFTMAFLQFLNPALMKAASALWPKDGWLENPLLK
jgi:hypothetical protein